MTHPRTSPAAEVASAALRGELDDERRPPAGLRPGELITGAELDSLVEQSTAPLASYVDGYRARFRIWAGRRPGGVGTADERLAATNAIAWLDAITAEAYVLRAKLIAECRANDDRHMALLSRARELAVEQTEAARPRCVRCGKAGGELVERSATALDTAPGDLVCADRPTCLDRQQRAAGGQE
jgi:hypothetical protein